MSMRITKYAEWATNAPDAVNSVMAALQARYEALGNTMEVIGGETLAAGQSTLTMSLNAVSYKLLFLKAWIRTNEVSGSPTLIALRGYDTSAVGYSTNHMIASPSAVTPAQYSSEPDTRLFAGDAGAGSLGQLKLWIWLYDRGYALTGSGTVVHSGGTMYTYRYTSILNDRPFTSLLLTQRVGNEAAQFQTGSYWKLSGVRA